MERGFLFFSFPRLSLIFYLFHLNKNKRVGVEWKKIDVILFLCVGSNTRANFVNLVSGVLFVEKHERNPSLS